MDDNLKEVVDVRTKVRERYGKIADEFSDAVNASCCGSAEASSGCCDTTASSNVVPLGQIYEGSDVSQLPQDVTGLSLGCGDPVALAALKPGQVVLDLGSGGGIDCFLAAQRVGETGRVIGIDMTPQMIEKARANKVRLNAANVEFRLGEIEHVPVADASVDVIISNCVINLSPDKPQVFREAFRVLRPGGKLSVSDIVTDGALPVEIKHSLSAWVGCIAGAMDVQDYIRAIEAAGFEEVNLTPVYMAEELIDEAAQQLGVDQVAAAAGEAIYKSIFSAKVTARKPLT